MAFKDKISQSMVYTETKKRPEELTPRQMVQEEIAKQREILAGTKKGTSWWDQANDCVTVTVRGASYFNEAVTGGNSGRLYGDDYLGKAWNKASVTKFIKDFETALLNDEFVDDTKYWHKRYTSKIAGSKGRVKGKATVKKKK